MTLTDFSATSADGFSGDSDTTVIVLKDANGNSQNITLSPEAHSQLVAVLNSTSAPGQNGDLSKIRPVIAFGVSPLRLQSGHYCLQFLVGQSAAIHVAFPPKALPSIRDALQKLENPSPRVGH